MGGWNRVPASLFQTTSKLTIITAGVKTLAGLFTRESIRGLAAEKEDASVLSGGFATQTFEALLHPRTSGLISFLADDVLKLGESSDIVASRENFSGLGSHMGRSITCSDLKEEIIRRLVL